MGRSDGFSVGGAVHEAASQRQTVGNSVKTFVHADVSL